MQALVSVFVVWVREDWESKERSGSGFAVRLNDCQIPSPSQKGTFFEHGHFG